MAVCSTLGLWLIALSGNRLAAFSLTGLAYPVTTAGSVVMFSLCSRFIFREPFHSTTWLGIVLTSAGLFLLGYR
jgi:multidrug transporter EmrE-like cation transporter